jgi:hypothetical protein
VTYLRRYPGRRWMESQNTCQGREPAVTWLYIYICVCMYNHHPVIALTNAENWIPQVTAKWVTTAIFGNTNIPLSIVIESDTAPRHFVFTGLTYKQLYTNNCALTNKPTQVKYRGSQVGCHMWAMAAVNEPKMEGALISKWKHCAE